MPSADVILTRQVLLDSNLGIGIAEFISVYDLTTVLIGRAFKNPQDTDAAKFSRSLEARERGKSGWLAWKKSG